MPVPVRALLAGKAVPFARGEYSAIAKNPIDGPVRIGFLGLETDEQADPRYHGGPDKAVHHQPFENYAHWRALKPNLTQLETPGAFGENISTDALSEDDVCIGDRLRLGSTLLEISQGRQPCWKQAEMLGWPQLPALMVRDRRSGWYYRVIEEGVAQVGDMLALVERPCPEWTVRRVFGLLIAGDHKRDPAALKALAALEPLDAGWRQRARDLSG
jgi:MOSC domain-containing protein YiiM